MKFISCLQVKFEKLKEFTETKASKECNFEQTIAKEIL